MELCSCLEGCGAGVLVGIVVMGEPLPSTFNLLVLRLLSWLVTIAGVSALANGKGTQHQLCSASQLAMPSAVAGYHP